MEVLEKVRSDFVQDYVDLGGKAWADRLDDTDDPFCPSATILTEMVTELVDGSINRKRTHRSIDLPTETRTDLGDVARALVEAGLDESEKYLGSCSQAEHRIAASIHPETFNDDELRQLIIYVDNNGTPYAIRKSIGVKSVFTTHHADIPAFTLGHVPHLRAKGLIRSKRFRKTKSDHISVVKSRTQEFGFVRATSIQVALAMPELGSADDIFHPIDGEHDNQLHRFPYYYEIEGQNVPPVQLEDLEGMVDYVIELAGV